MLTVGLLAGLMWQTAAAREIKVLQLNIWQEGTSVPGGYESMIDEIAYADADFVMLSEVRNYNGTRLCDRMIASLRAKGLTYYSFKSKDSGLLSKYPISDSVTIFPEKDDHGSLYKLVATLPEGQRVSVYTAHLDYLNCAYYRVRGYDGTTWKELPGPDTDLESVLADNVASQRDDAIRCFIAEARKDIAEGTIVILGGDFNEPSHLDWIRETKDLYDHNGLIVPWTVPLLLDNAGFVDTYRTLYPDVLKYPGFTFPIDNPLVPVEQLTWAPEADERDRIDYVFYYPHPAISLKDAVIFGPKGSIVNSKRVPNESDDKYLLPEGVWPTDHKGVLVTFGIR